MITKEKLANDLRKVRQEIGKIPTREEYQKFGIYGRSTIGRRWGSWTNALDIVFDDYEKPPESQSMKCGYEPCNKWIRVEPSQIKTKNYCSVSCANKDKPRRKKLPRPQCETCTNKAKSRRGKYCNKCLEELKMRFVNKTIGQLREERQDATRYSQVREHARRMMKESKKEKECVSCGYHKHVHTCHKKDIGDFPDQSTVKEINSLDNLVYLCPNCHWEFDHNLLKL
jgi:hypothetical protein